MHKSFVILLIFVIGCLLLSGCSSVRYLSLKPDTINQTKERKEEFGYFFGSYQYAIKKSTVAAVSVGLEILSLSAKGEKNIEFGMDRDSGYFVFDVLPGTYKINRIIMRYNSTIVANFPINSIFTVYPDKITYIGRVLPTLEEKMNLVWYGFKDIEDQIEEDTHNIIPQFPELTNLVVINNFSGN